MERTSRGEYLKPRGYKQLADGQLLVIKGMQPQEQGKSPHPCQALGVQREQRISNFTYVNHTLHSQFRCDVDLQTNEYQARCRACMQT